MERAHEEVVAREKLEKWKIKLREANVRMWISRITKNNAREKPRRRWDEHERKLSS